MESLGYLEIFRQRWLAIALIVVLGVGSAAIVAFTMPPTYAATATLFLSVKDANATLAERSQFSLARVASYPDLVHSEDVLQPTIDELELELSVQELSAQVSATNPDNTVLIDVTARSGAGATAAEIANTVAEHLSHVVADIENDNAFSVLLDRRMPAITPLAPIAPQKTVILGLGFIAGLALGAIVALLLARFDRRIRTVAEVRRASGLPVLGLIPRRLLPRRHDAVEPIVAAAMADAMLSIRQANGGGVPRLLLLVPAGRGAAPTHIRLGFAGAAASAGRDVLLVETERAVKQGEDLTGARDATGLAELLAGTRTLASSARTVDSLGIRVLPAGSREITDVTAEASIRSVVTLLISEADIVIAQSTPTGRPASTPLLAPYADVAIVIARHGRSKDSDLAKAVSQLRIIGVRPIGVVLVEVPRGGRVDLTATWQPEDFAEKPAKALINVRRKTARADSTEEPPAAAVESTSEQRADELDFDHANTDEAEADSDTASSTIQATAEEQVVPG